MSDTQRRMTFWFDAEACSGCKACQIACKDRNDLGTGVLWRRVSEVTGGTWEQDGAAWRNSVFAYHLSMSCNHCERPICLEGCPTGAITARSDGVVLLNEDQCMGCGYCSWVCPYSAPQYGAECGSMSKCSFCVEDIDAGLEPACVAACPVRALDAGNVVELAERHGAMDAAAAEMAPLPPAAMTEPALQILPHADATRSTEPSTELTPRPARGLREWSLVVFTVLSQTAAGLALWAGVLRTWIDRPPDGVLMSVTGGLMVAALGVSTLHLGRRKNAVRSLLNLRSSWLSREVLLAVVFLGAVLTAWLSSAAAVDWLPVAAAAAFLVGMAKVYMQRTVPVWNSRRTPIAFAATALFLGGLLANAVVWSSGVPTAEQAPAAAPGLSWLAVGAALIHQLLRRRKFYARYERIGV